MDSVFIYALKDPRTGAVRYIGKAKNPRVRFLQHLKLRRANHLSNWIRHLKNCGAEPVMEVLDEVLENCWEFFERAYIKVYREAGAKLTNATDGGEGCPAGEAHPSFGRKHTPEARMKMSRALKGKKRTPEQCANMSAGHKGQKRSLESIAKAAASNTGKKRSKEVCENQSGEKNPNYGRVFPPEIRLRMSEGRKAARAKREAEKNVVQ